MFKTDPKELISIDWSSLITALGAPLGSIASQYADDVGDSESF